MYSPLKGHQPSTSTSTSTSTTGWTGIRTSIDPPRTIERKRKGRNVDIIGESLPTPHAQTHLPTPETVRRPAKSPRKPHASSSTAQLPTPQTQRRRRTAPTSTDASSPPSPSGHTTFFLSSASASTSRPEKIRRRPGLTFAQQMGLISTNSRGVGVGMGGHRSSTHGKVDLIPSTILESESQGNPFVVPSSSMSGQVLGEAAGIASPGFITMHHPGDDHESDDELLMVSPFRTVRRSPRLASPSPSATLSRPLLPFASASGLLSPPPTQHAARIGALGKSGSKTGMTREQKARAERQKREAEEQRRMLDYEDNPFLVKAGESSTRRPGPIVDEDRSTVTYVFRGAKKVFANPLYPSTAPFPQAELDPTDEEFEPHPLPKPKLLWPTGPTPSKAVKRPAFARTPSPDLDRSPPSSPVATPTMKVSQGRFRTLSRVHSGGLDGGPADVFTDDEVIIEHEEAEEEEEHVPSRRGLLFPVVAGRAGTGTGAGAGLMKRTLEGHEERKTKKARGTFRL